VKDPKTKHDLWVLPLVGDKKPFPFLRTEFNEEDGRFSPDGHWIVYASGVGCALAMSFAKKHYNSIAQASRFGGSACLTLG
jgi:hypothetical protein